MSTHDHYRANIADCHGHSVAHSCTGRPDSDIDLLSIAKDFSATPGGRYRHQGPNSGEQFLEEVLLPRFEEAERANKILMVDLDGGFGYASSFLEEAFGGLVRKKKSVAAVEHLLRFVSKEEPYQIRDIHRYMQEALVK
jgi:STAS-like domain of unknown function (DUF4325)